MTFFDYAVLGGVALSVLLGFWRGVVSEILSLVAWIAALVLAKAFASRLAPEFARWVPDGAIQYLLAFVAIAAVVLLLSSVVRLLTSGLLRAIGLGFMDRFLGAIFGLARGMLVVLVLVAAAGVTALPKQAWWRDAMLAPPLETVVIAIKPWLPQAWASRIRYR